MKAWSAEEHGLPIEDNSYDNDQFEIQSRYKYVLQTFDGRTFRIYCDIPIRFDDVKFEWFFHYVIAFDQFENTIRKDLLIFRHSDIYGFKRYKNENYKSTD